MAPWPALSIEGDVITVYVRPGVVVKVVEVPPDVPKCP